MSYKELNKSSEAIKIFERIQQDKNHQYYVKTFFQLGMIFFEEKKWDKAISYWKEYIQIETRKDSIVRTKFLMANAYETMELLKKAYNIYYSILGEYPNTKVIKNRLESIYNRRVSRKR